ncbi:MAG TPA: TonB-dependent receptor [Gemmatimonadaceae bacterium]|nr:TonB-dependent receptor [Gemmatimonadaceae bacterium]
MALVRAIAFSAALIAATALPAQETETPPPPSRPPQRLAPVVVTVTRDAGRSPLEVPFAVTSLNPDSMRPGQRHLALDESLLLLPGVAVVNRNNPTQDPRVSVRGFGSRSAFGVRGVRVLRDGMPLTLPDGQTPVDFLDLESVGSVEVLRGTASALYGNASGGVVDLRSAAPPNDRFSAQLRGWGSSYDSHRWTGAIGGTSGSLGYQANVSHTDLEGYRRYARQRVLNAFGRGVWTVGSTELALVAMGFDMPLAQNPGALTQEQFDTDPRQADQQNLDKQARKDVRQWQIGLAGRRPLLATGEVAAMVYGGWRSLANPLAFSINDIDRKLYGASLRGMAPVRVLGLDARIGAGVDLQRQDDDRIEFTNCIVGGVPTTIPTPTCPVPGEERGSRRRDQRELVSSVGPYVRTELDISDKFAIHGGLRADYVKFDVTDHLITPTNPDDSGDRTLSAWSPMVGAVARVTEYTSLYVNYSTAFETPTVTELNNSEGVSGGINRDLDPQRARTVEGGVKGFILPRVQYDVAIFDARVKNELIPFEIPNSGGRRFFRNAGRTKRRGAEGGLTVTAGDFIVGASYSYSDFKFDEYVVSGTDFSGKRIPGVPVQQAQASVTWRKPKLFITSEVIGSTKVFVDDANSASADGFAIVNLRVGSKLLMGRPWISPVFGIQNLFDKKYVGSVSVNATGGKFFEPAPGRVVFIGLTAAVGQ